MKVNLKRINKVFHYEAATTDKIKVNIPRTLSPKMNTPVSNNVQRAKVDTGDSELKSMIIVDDNSEIVDYIYSIFVREYQIYTAKDGKEALDLILKNIPDMIISDVMMPHMDGIELCEKVKSTLVTSHIPFIFLSAKSMISDKMTGLRLGATDYLAKPFHPEELRLKVKNILSANQVIKYDELNQIDKEFSPRKVPVTSLDEEFLQLLIETTEKNIENHTINRVLKALI